MLLGGKTVANFRGLHRRVASKFRQKQQKPHSGACGGRGRVGSFHPQGRSLLFILVLYGARALSFELLCSKSYTIAKYFF